MRRPRLALLAVVLVLTANGVVLATGAASDDGDDDTAAPTTTTSTTVVTDTATDATEAVETTVAPTSGEPAETTTTTAASATTTTTTAAPETTAPASSWAMPAPGRYTMNVTGTANGNQVSEQSELVVTQLSDTDQEHAGESPQGRTVQVMRYTPDAVLLVSWDLAGFKQFQPNPPVQFAPVPLTVGASWQWQITSTDGETDLAQSSRVARAETITVGGQAVDTFVVETDVTLTGDIDGEIHATSWASPSHGLAVRSHQVSDVRAFPFRFRSNTVSELASLTPA